MGRLLQSSKAFESLEIVRRRTQHSAADTRGCASWNASRNAAVGTVHAHHRFGLHRHRSGRSGRRRCVLGRQRVVRLREFQRLATDVLWLVKLADEGNRPPGDDGQLDVLPIRLARVLDDRPAFDRRLVLIARLVGKRQTVGGFPRRRGNQVARKQVAALARGLDPQRFALLRLSLLVSAKRLCQSLLQLVIRELHCRDAIEVDDA